MSRTRVVVQGAAFSGASVFLSMAALLVVGKVFTNVLTVREVAAFAAIMVTADFLNIALGLGIFNGLPKMIAAAPKSSRSDYVRAAMIGQATVALIFSLLFYASYFLLGDLLSGYIDRSPLAAASWLAIGLIPPLFAVGNLRETGMAALAGLDRYATRATAITIASVGQVTFVVIALVILDAGLTGLVLATIGAHAASVLFMLSRLPFPPGDVPTREAWNALVRFSFPLYINGILTFFYTRFDFFLVSAMLGSVAAGIYETVKRLPTMLSRILNAMLVPYLPNVSALIAQDDREGASRMLHHALGLSAFLGYAVALGTVAFQEFLIGLLFSDAYLPGTAVVGLLLVAIALTVQAGIIGQSLIALGHPKAITLINCGLAIAGVVGNLFLLPRFDLAGAGYAALSAIALSYILQALAARHYGLMIRWSVLLRPQLALAVAAVVLYMGDGAMLYPLLALGVFVTLCIALGVVTPQHFRAVLSALRPVPKNGTPP